MKYFSRLLLRKDACQNKEYWNIFQNDYRLHQVLWRAFSDHAERKRDYIYRLDWQQGSPVIYTVSERMPRNDSIWDVKTKDYSPQLKKGDKLFFNLRINPIRKRKNPKEPGKSSKIDEIMHYRFLQDKKETESRTEIAERVCSDWLKDRFKNRTTDKNYAMLDSNIRVISYQVRKFWKRGKEKPVTLGVCDLEGIIQVTEPELFVQEALFKGVGPAKAFGCGLMLIRRM